MDNRTSRFGNRQILIVAAVIVALVAVGGLIYWLVISGGDEQSTMRANSSACDTGHIQRFNEATDPLSISELSSLTEEIESIDGHDRNANCLYILTRQQLAIGDADAAEESLEQLRAISPDGVELSSQFSPAPVQYELLESSIENLRFDEEQNEPNPLWEGSE